jgi:hypothetical protein
LTTGLLSFDALFIVLTTIRKFITDHTVSLNVQTSVTLSLQLATFTVGLMTVERYSLILKPMWYMKTVSRKLIVRTVCFIWILNIFLSMSFRYGVCYLQTRSVSVFTEAGTCNKTTSAFYGILLIIVLSTSSLCYYKIFKCIQSKNPPGNILSLTLTAKRIYSYRSTFLVFIYLIVIIVSSLAYGIIIVLIHIQDLKYTQLRLALEFVSLFNCLLDPFLYVLWFKECRLQLVVFLGKCFKRYRQKSETMRIDVFNIVTRDIRDTQDSTMR